MRQPNLQFHVKLVVHNSMWQESNAPDSNWRLITCSSDGTKLAATQPNGIYYSYDSGVTWNESHAQQQDYFAINCNSDFTKLYAGTNQSGNIQSGNIYESSDGINWNVINTPNNDGWLMILSYNNKIIANEVNGNVYFYDNGWNNVTTPLWTISSSVNFTIFYGCDFNLGGIYKSLDGIIWQLIQNSPVGEWNNIACSSDGSKVIAGGWNGYVWISYDYGVTWFNSGLSTSNWGVYVSGDGKTFIAYQNGLIYFSNDGINWTDSGARAPPSRWEYIVCNYDGTKIFAIVNGGGIYYYFKPPISDVCFIKDTIVQTDQGKFPIQSLTKQTIHRMPITLTNTSHHDPYLVKIESYAFGDCPTKDTYMSLKHKVYLNKPIQAKHLINDDTVTLVPYNGETLYNVLLDKHTSMKVHGMMVETLDPNCLIALFYKSKLSPKQKDKMIITINKEPEKALTILKSLVSR